ncbi:unnamed protein product, partial [Phaeothamnion confervicola]
SKACKNETVTKGPRFEELSPAAQARLTEAVQLDRRLYDAASQYYEEIKAR